MAGKDPLWEANERISRRFFDKTLELIKELEAENDGPGLDALPTVMVTTGVMALCRTLPTDTVSAVLEALRAKVDRGEFTSERGLEEE